jgi:hypothetical protein
VPQSIAAPPLLVTRREPRVEMPTSGPDKPPAIVAVSGHAPRGEPLFPDLRGLSARDALRAVSLLGMTARLRGAGFVVNQAPLPGTAVARGTETTLWLERAPIALASNRPEP